MTPPIRRAQHRQDRHGAVQPPAPQQRLLLRAPRHARRRHVHMLRRRRAAGAGGARGHSGRRPRARMDRESGRVAGLIEERVGGVCVGGFRVEVLRVWKGLCDRGVRVCVEGGGLRGKRKGKA
jgi:hypothetical protein